tara:strand:- start:4879 stop:5073 length:195 start_codon:yes stop_codon:yes gene_type:complete
LSDFEDATQMLCHEINEEFKDIFDDGSGTEREVRSMPAEVLAICPVLDQQEQQSGKRWGTRHGN